MNATRETAPRTGRELHLHVGMHKTGTTFLQKCLDLNRAALEAQGFTLAPMQDVNGAHHPLAWKLRDEGPEAMAAVLRAAEGRRLIAASEVFCEVMTRPEPARALAAVLAPHFDVTIHLVLRRQDFLKESGYAEAMKFSPHPASIRVEPDEAKMDDVTFDDNPDIDRLVGFMAEAFGPGNIRLAIYDDAVRRDPLTQFCGLLGISLENPVRPERLNESLSRRRTLFLSHMRKPELRLAWFAFPVIARSRFIDDDDCKFLLSPAQRRAVVARYLDGNRRIVERYAPEGGEVLLEAPPDDPAWFPPAPIRLTEFLGVAFDLMDACLAKRNWRRGRRGRVRDALVLGALCVEAAIRARWRSGERMTAARPRPQIPAAQRTDAT